MGGVGTGRQVVIIVACLVLLVGAGTAVGAQVDRVRSDGLQQLLRDADELAVSPPKRNPLPYFTMHNNLAAAAGVESCSALAARMTQRFLPKGWHFHPEDVAALEAGDALAKLRLQTGEDVGTDWHC